MERKFAIPRRMSPFTRARSCASTVNVPCALPDPGDPNFLSPTTFSYAASSGVNWLKHRHNPRTLHVARSDPLEMRPDAAQLGIDKAVHKMQTSIQPGEKFVFDFVVDGERD